MSRIEPYRSLETIRQISFIRPTGSTFINGISNSYDVAPSPLLSEILSTSEMQRYEIYMRQLNRKIKQFWPCLFAYYCGYGCSVCTIGLSLCIPHMCVADVEEVLRQEVNKINEEVLKNKKLKMRLVKACCQSHLIIEEIDFYTFEMHD